MARRHLGLFIVDCGGGSGERSSIGSPPKSRRCAGGDRVAGQRCINISGRGLICREATLRNGVLGRKVRRVHRTGERRAGERRAVRGGQVVPNDLTRSSRGSRFFLLLIFRAFEQMS